MRRSTAKESRSVEPARPLLPRPPRSFAKREMPALMSLEPLPPAAMVTPASEAALRAAATSGRSTVSRPQSEEVVAELTADGATAAEIAQMAVVESRLTWVYAMRGDTRVSVFDARYRQGVKGDGDGHGDDHGDDCGSGRDDVEARCLETNATSSSGGGSDFEFAADRRWSPQSPKRRRALDYYIGLSDASTLLSRVDARARRAFGAWRLSRGIAGARLTALGLSSTFCQVLQFVECWRVPSLRLQQ